jgi:putative intracellular protease/amidase
MVASGVSALTARAADIRKRPIGNGVKSLLVLPLLLLGLCLPSLADDKPVVLLIARGETTVGGAATLKYEIDKEVSAIISKLNAFGYAVDVASESGKLIQAGESTLTVGAKLADVQVDRYAGVIIPCMGEREGAVPQQAVKIVQDLNAKNLPVAAQHSGVEILGAAGLLKNRDFAVGEGWQAWSPHLKDGRFRGLGVVRDGNVVTSGTCPWLAALSGQILKDGTDDLVATFATMLKK